LSEALRTTIEERERDHIRGKNFLRGCEGIGSFQEEPKLNWSFFPVSIRTANQPAVGIFKQNPTAEILPKSLGEKEFMTRRPGYRDSPRRKTRQPAADSGGLKG